MAGPTCACGRGSAALEVLGVVVAGLALEVRLFRLGVGDSVRAAQVQVLRAGAVPFDLGVAGADLAGLIAVVGVVRGGGSRARNPAATTVAKVIAILRSMGAPSRQCVAGSVQTKPLPPPAVQRRNRAAVLPDRT